MSKYLEDIFSLENKIALVTGAARGNGKVIAEALLRAGNTLGIKRDDRNQERMLRRQRKKDPIFRKVDPQLFGESLDDLIQQRSIKTSFLSPKILLTKNRKDIEYRIEFLRNVFNEGLSPEHTLYYQFISDSGTRGGIDEGTDPKKFISLYEDIKKNKMLEPIVVRQYSKKTIKTRYFLNGKKIWKNYTNENGFQLINGAHRLAVMIFLGSEEIPVKIYNSLSFEVPNYTDYIKTKETEYKENLKMKQDGKKEDYLSRLFSVENKIAIVTGASRGNGKAISEGLLKAGATVILVDILEKELELTEENFKEQNLNAIKFKCDITSKTEIQGLYHFVKTKFKKLDILINNAGVTFSHSSLDYPENFWEDTYKVNLKAPFELCKIFGKMMKESNSGVIINITSLGAELAFPDNPSYGAFKAGLKHLTKTLALDLGKFGIRVNNVSPGYMRTDMTKKSWDDPVLRQKRTDRTILGRWGESSDLVGSIIFLCSDSSSYITGLDLFVDGGWTIKGL